MRGIIRSTNEYSMVSGNIRRITKEYKRKSGLIACARKLAIYYKEGITLEIYNKTGQTEPDEVLNIAIY